MKTPSPPEALSELESCSLDPGDGRATGRVFDTDVDAAQNPYGETFHAFMLGTVLKAVSDYVRYKNSANGKLRELAKHAEAWLFVKTDPYKDVILGSFEWVCMVLDRDPNGPRERIKVMGVEDLPKVDRRKG